MPRHRRTKSDQGLRLGPVAVGNVRAHDDVLLPRVAVKQRLEACEQQHEHRHVLLLAKRLQRLAESGRQHEALRRAARTLNDRARPVRRQFEHRHAAQSLAPVTKLRLKRLALQPPPLPDSEVRVLHGEFRQGRRPPVREGFVERRHLAHEHTLRPAIADDVVHGE